MFWTQSWREKSSGLFLPICVFTFFNNGIDYIDVKLMKSCIFLQYPCWVNSAEPELIRAMSHDRARANQGVCWHYFSFAFACLGPILVSGQNQTVHQWGPWIFWSSAVQVVEYFPQTKVWGNFTLFTVGLWREPRPTSWVFNSVFMLKASVTASETAPHYLMLLL